MLSRRALVGKLAACTAAVWAAGIARISSASTGGEREWEPGMEPVGATPDDHQPSASVEAIHAPQLDPNAGLHPDVGPLSTVEAVPPWELLRPLKMGSHVARGWRVAGFTGLVDGVCVLTLQNGRGRTHRVHICRNDGTPQGFVYTKQLDLVVMNGGAGDLPTEEGFAHAVAKIAHVLASNEQTQRVVAELLPQQERVRRFSGPMDRRLR
jgi:hypothetical protein